MVPATAAFAADRNACNAVYRTDAAPDSASRHASTLTKLLVKSSEKRRRGLAASRWNLT
jgi:hypothetical protein